MAILGRSVIMIVGKTVQNIPARLLPLPSFEQCGRFGSRSQARSCREQQLLCRRRSHNRRQQQWYQPHGAEPRFGRGLRMMKLRFKPGLFLGLFLDASSHQLCNKRRVIAFANAKTRNVTHQLSTWKKTKKEQIGVHSLRENAFRVR